MPAGPTMGTPRILAILVTMPDMAIPAMNTPGDPITATRTQGAPIMGIVITIATLNCPITTPIVLALTASALSEAKSMFLVLVWSYTFKINNITHADKTPKNFSMGMLAF